MVSHEAAALALARHVCHPRKLSVRVLRTLRGLVLQEGPVRVHYEHSVVADALELVDLVAHHSRLPVPVAAQAVLAVLLVERDHPRLCRKCNALSRVLRVPLHRRAHRHLVCLLWSHVLARLGLRLASHAEIRPGEESDVRIAGAVSEKWSIKHRERASHHIPPGYGGDAVAVFLRRDDPRVEEEADVLLGRHRVKLALILVAFGRLCVAALRGTDLRHHVTETRIRAEIHSPAEMHAHLARVRSAEHRAVLHECHLQSQTRRRDRRTRPRNAAAAHNEVSLHCARRSGRVRS